MARKLRIEYAGAIYHVTVRMLGDWKREENLLFEDDADRERFLGVLADRVEQFGIRLYLFVLMSNHFHLVLETPKGNCGRFMQSLTTAYTVYFNLRHHRHGHLVDGRYKAKLVDGEEYLLKLSRYVHLNPVWVGPVKDLPVQEKLEYLRSYRWSSYGGYMGKEKPLEYVEYGPVLSEMSGKRRAWPRRYREYVESDLAEDDEELKAVLKASPGCIGGEGFRTWVNERYDELLKKHKKPEDVSFRRTTRLLEPETVLRTLAEVLEVPKEEFRKRRRNCALRGVAAKLLGQYAGVTQREVAGLLKVGSGAAISQNVRRMSAKLAGDKKLARRVSLVRTRLEGMLKPTESRKRAAR
ncbi:MAG TPA: hypothetical protein DCZ95_16560 [Verrucomicrobia bacterium]|nr:MAG: hypothetical protein A2X46_13045 [Lentisphaerae bacterium GWF2_57_35]HBA85695.1 hypothetical protein [Verrucomicrobiota bacterium]